MKLFLLKELKGKGKAGDFVEVKGGYANFLIKAGIALDADSNKSEINKIIQAKIDAANDELQLAYHLAEDLSNVKLTFTEKLSPRGDLVKKITKNDIIDRLPEKLKQNIDKRMLIMENISTAGVYDIVVKLHNQVSGNIRVIVEAITA